MLNEKKMNKLKTIAQLSEYFNKEDLYGDLELTPQLRKFVAGCMEHARRTTLDVVFEVYKDWNGLDEELIDKIENSPELEII